MQILFVGESWKGSFARAMREALEALPGVALHSVAEDQYLPKAYTTSARVASRLLFPWHRRQLERAIGNALAAQRPDALVVYKGSGVSAGMVRRAKELGVLTVNIFPDYSPHVYGSQLKEALGAYDLVVSTKPFHPPAWTSIYGYQNRCVFVPHGYDPTVHLWSAPPGASDFDVVLAATWRPQYQALMQALAAGLAGHALRVGIVGGGWAPHLDQLPSDWQVAPSLIGRRYGEWLRRGSIAIAPVNSDVVINGVRQPGDEETTRTYELAAMGCFFLHRRTPYAQSLYDEHTEVPMWDDAQELTALVLRYLPMEAERRALAVRAHTRAVPAYSILHRATQVLEHVTASLGTASNLR